MCTYIKIVINICLSYKSTIKKIIFLSNLDTSIQYVPRVDARYKRLFPNKSSIFCSFYQNLVKKSIGNLELFFFSQESNK